MKMNVCNYKPIRLPYDVSGINLRFETLFKQVCFLAAGGSAGTQNLQQVLTEGNTGDLPIFLTADAAKLFISDAAGDNITTVDPDGITIQNPGGFTSRIIGDLATSNIVAQLQDGSGIIAYLSDIPLGGPMIINSQPTDYTLQLSDGDNNTLVEIDSAIDNTITLDSATGFLKGTTIMVSSLGIGQTTIVPAGSTVILTPNGVDPDLTFQNSMALLVKRDDSPNEEWYLSGDVGDTGGVGAPGGADRTIQFNDSGLFGGIPIFTYDPSNPYGFLELTTVDNSVLDAFSIIGDISAGHIFSVRNILDPTNDIRFAVGGAGGFMNGVWDLSGGGQFNISTAAPGLNDMLKFNNIGVSWASSLSDTNQFVIRDVTNNIQRIGVNADGTIKLNTDTTPSIGDVFTAIDTAGNGDWLSASGGGWGLTGTVATLTGNSNVEIGSNAFEISNGLGAGTVSISINPTLNNESMYSYVVDPTDDGNISSTLINSTPSQSRFKLEASFNDGIKIASIEGTADGGTTTIAYNADNNNFNGNITALLGVTDIVEPDINLQGGDFTITTAGTYTVARGEPTYSNKLYIPDAASMSGKTITIIRIPSHASLNPSAIISLGGLIYNSFGIEITTFSQGTYTFKSDGVDWHQVGGITGAGVVASVDLVGELADNSNVLSFTPEVDGVFRIGGNVNVTSIALGTISVKITYKDIYGTTVTSTLTLSASNGNISGAAGGVTGVTSFPDVQITAQAGTSITVFTTFNIGGVSSYDISATIEKIRDKI